MNIIYEERCKSMAFHLPGIHTPHRKKTAKAPTVRMTPPKSVTLPMTMHIGKPAIPTVKAGDFVKIGTKIGEADGKISSPVLQAFRARSPKSQITC